MKKVIPPNLFTPYRCFEFGQKCPSDMIINYTYDIMISDMGLNDNEYEKMMKLDIKKRWEFIQAQNTKYSQLPSPQCIIKYITMDDYQNFNANSIEYLHSILKDCFVTWIAEFVSKFKGHTILINKIQQYEAQDNFKNLHENEKDINLFKCLLQCINDIQNIDSCQHELINDKTLMYSILNALFIQNDDIFILALKDLLPYTLFAENVDKIIKYFEKCDIYHIVSNILKKNSESIYIKITVKFLNSLYIRLDKLDNKINFILQLQKESIITQLHSLELSDAQIAISGLNVFLNNIDEILVPLNQAFTSSFDFNPLKDNDLYKYITKIISKKVVFNMNLSLIEIEKQHKQHFDKAYIFIHNFLVIYRQYLSKGIDIPLNNIVNHAASMNDLYDPCQNETIEDKFYKTLYKKTSFVPSTVLKNLDVSPYESDDNGKNQVATNKENNEALNIQKKAYNEDKNEMENTINSLKEQILYLKSQYSNVQQQQHADEEKKEQLIAKIKKNLKRNLMIKKKKLNLN